MRDCGLQFWHPFGMDPSALAPMSPEFFFVNALQDIRAAIASRDTYALIKAAGLVRKLLMDSPRLADMVNSKFPPRTKLEFRMTDIWFDLEHPAVKTMAYGFILESLNPDDPANGRFRTVVRSRGAFLKTKVGLVNGTPYTVYGVLRHFANKRDHHYDNDGVDPGMIVGESWSLDGMPVTVHQLAPILQIVVRALEPIEQRIQAAQQSG